LVDGEEIILTLNSLDSKIPRVEIVKNNEVIPEVIDIFNSWFDTYSNDGRMMNEHLAKFLKDVINSEVLPELDDKQITKLFETYDKANNGYLEREGFIKFYTYATLSKSQTVWENLNAMGVRNDLKMVNRNNLYK